MLSHYDYKNLADLSNVLDAYMKEQLRLEEARDMLEKSGCPRPESQYLYKMMRDYQIAPFAGTPDSYPAWFEDDVQYFEIINRLADLPYLIRDINKSISQVKT